MTTHEKILPFCSTDSDRKNQQIPCVVSGFIYALDGKRIVRARTDAPDTPESKMTPVEPALLDKLYRNYSGEFNRCGGPVWKELPLLVEEVRDLSICNSCSGHGTYFVIEKGKEKENKHCEDCRGTGEINYARPTRQDVSCQEQGTLPAIFNVAYLKDIKSLGKTVAIAVLRPEHPLWFIVDGGELEGFVMPILREKGT